MDEITDPKTQADEDAAQLAARRKERRARRRMRQAMAEAAAAAAADQAREDGAEAPAPDYDNAKPASGRRGDDGARREPEIGEPSRQPAGKTEIARIEPSGLQKAPKPGALADTVPDDAFMLAQRARDTRMKEIRRELRRRRRFRSLGILLRFALFVLIPTAFVGWYYYEKATDMYVSESAMVFKGASLAGGGAAGGAAGLLGGGALPTDPISLQEYILSRDLLKRLDDEHGWIKHFQSTDIDEYHRLAADATFDDAYSYFQGDFLTSGKVEVSFDLMEGIIRMEVTGATPEASKRFADAIIGYGEEQVNSLNERSRYDGLKIAEENVEKARAGMTEAQNEIIKVQEQIDSYDIGAESSALLGRISELEALIDEVKTKIAKLETVAKDPNDSRYVPLRLDLAQKERQVAELREKLTGNGADGGPSNAQLQSMMQIAQTEFAAAQLNYNSALQSRQVAIQAASLQSLYLETVVQPSAPQKADKPNRLANTGLVFLVLFAAYIIGMLTVSLIREQAAI